jgi:hypothetical protein
MLTLYNFPGKLYGFETWSFIKEHRLRVFKNRVLPEIFGLQWKKVTGDWKK